MNKANNIIRALNLALHPEGGYFRETYRSKGEITQENLGPNFEGSRNYSTCIYFLLTSDGFSAFHKIRQDEIWHFYNGSPIKLHLIGKNGEYSKIIIGSDFTKGQIPQYVVAYGTWFAAEVINKNDYSLLGCTVAPGFNFLDFELAKRNELIVMFPQYKSIITTLTRS
ncbi:MAG: cupin domain-containing protein [Bacteroidetes bacterium]|nr:cupin domain-containing protein [Bacteroidota bacterium]